MGKAVPCCVWLDSSPCLWILFLFLVVQLYSIVAGIPRKRRKGNSKERKERKGKCEKNGNKGIRHHKPKRKNVMANSDCYSCWDKKRVEYRMYLGGSMSTFPKSHWLRRSTLNFSGLGCQIVKKKEVSWVAGFFLFTFLFFWDVQEKLSHAPIIPSLLIYNALEIAFKVIISSLIRGFLGIWQHQNQNSDINVYFLKKLTKNLGSYWNPNFIRIQKWADLMVQ